MVLIAQLTDTHLRADPDASDWGHHPAQSVSRIMSMLPPVDSIVVTGDVAHDGTEEAYRLADSLIRQGSAPRFFVAGNHDDPDAMRSVFGETPPLRLVDLSPRWTAALLNSQWLGHDAGLIPDVLLDRLRSELDRVASHVVLCLHHPPLSPCSQPDCGLIDGDRLVDTLCGGPVRVVLSGHVHQHFATTTEGIVFIGAPSTLNQLRHGGDPHYTDTDEPPNALLLELFDDGSVEYRTVVPTP